jgi:hypothetical protein
MQNEQTITNDLAGNYIAAMMDLNEFKLNLNFEQAKYLAAIMVTMQKHSIDEILNFESLKNKPIEQIEKFKTTTHKLENLHKLITIYDQENLNSFNLPE